MTYLLLTITGWDEPPRARHQVARALAKHGEVLFVARNRLGTPGLASRRVEDNITLIEPSWPLDYRYRYRLPGINELYLNWLLRNLRQRHGDARMITFDHTAAMMRRYFPRYAYFCNDDYIGNSSVRFAIADRYHVRTEKHLAERATAIAATSPYLVKKLSVFNDNVSLIPLGAPVVTDAQLATCPPRPRDGLRIGLVGFIGRRIPKSLLNLLLEQDDARLSLVGPIEKGFLDGLVHRERIDTPGVLTGDDLVKEIAGFDVAIAPYDLAGINKGVTPNKLWQYLAVGRPAVVTRLPNMADWTFPDGCVYTADDNDDFVRMVRRAFEEDTPELATGRIAFARENSWDKRILDLLELMG